MRQAAPRVVRREGRDPAVDGNDAAANPIAGRVELLSTIFQCVLTQGKSGFHEMSSRNPDLTFYIPE